MMDEVSLCPICMEKHPLNLIEETQTLFDDVGNIEFEYTLTYYLCDEALEGYETEEQMRKNRENYDKALSFIKGVL